MLTDLITRRNVLKSLSMGVAAGSVLRAIPLEAAEYAHSLIQAEQADAKAGGYAPKFFTPHQYKTLQMLCETIIPADADSGGAIEAGAPEFIDLLTSENEDYKTRLGGGLMWLDSTCADRYGSVYSECAAHQQKEILDLIAYRKNAETDEDLEHGVAFFSLLRNMTSDGFFTSKIGIQYLGYIGNSYLLEFPGCPPVPGV
jgi:hypothetical protein